MSSVSTATVADVPAALLQSDALPSMPGVALEVLRVTDDPEAALADLCSVLEKDPALSAKLIKLVNSPVTGTRHAVSTLTQATAVLGMKTCRMMALGFSLVGAMPRSKRSGAFCYESFWRRSIAIAVAARDCAQRTRTADADEAFLCGIVSMLGRLVVATRMPHEFDRVLSASPGWPDPVIEREMLGFDPTGISAAVCSAWHFPTAMTEAMERLCEVGDSAVAAERLDSEDPELRLTKLLWVGRLVQEILHRPDCGDALVELRDCTRRAYGWTDDDVDEFLVGIEESIHSLADLFEAADGGQDGHLDIVERAREQILETGIEASIDLHRSQQQVDELIEENSDLEQRARVDGLTRLPNRATFDDAFERQISWRMRQAEDLSIAVLMIDVDHFKTVNDTHGHPAGDAVLVNVARALGSGLRRGDFAARYGGEEFIVLLPSINAAGLKIVAERLRKSVAALVVPSAANDGVDITVTVSLGAAVLPRVGSLADGARLIETADAALYEAKRGGRNRTVLTCLAEAGAAGGG